MRIKWISEHAGIEGNEIADKETKEAASSPIDGLLLSAEYQEEVQQHSETTLTEGHHSLGTGRIGQMVDGVYQGNSSTQYWVPRYR
jgi:hypothetical protein